MKKQFFQTLLYNTVTKTSMLQLQNIIVIEIYNMFPIFLLNQGIIRKILIGKVAFKLKFQDREKRITSVK